MGIEGRTVFLVACARGAGLCGYDAFSGRFGDGDHEVVDFLEIEVRHFGIAELARKELR
jgi:hypothetical protein